MSSAIVPPSKRSWAALKALVSLGVIFWLFSHVNCAEIIRQLLQAKWTWLAASVALLYLIQLMSALRWRQLIELLHGSSPSLMDTFHHYMSGTFFSLFLPTAIGGDVFRVRYLQKYAGIPWSSGALSVVLDRGFGLIALLMVTFTGVLMINPSAFPTGLKEVLMGLLGMALLGWILVYWAPIDQWGQRWPVFNVVSDIQGVMRRGRNVFQMMVLSLFAYFLAILVFVCIANALSLSLSFLYLGCLFGVVTIITLLPVTINGLGLREGVFQVLLVHYGISSEAALSFSLIWFSLSMLIGLLGSIHYQLLAKPLSQDVLRKGSSASPEVVPEFPVIPGIPG